MRGLLLYFSFMLTSTALQAEERVFKAEKTKKLELISVSGTIETITKPGTDIRIIYTKLKPEAFDKNCHLMFEEKEYKLKTKVEKTTKLKSNPCEISFQIETPSLNEVEIDLAAGNLSMKGNYEKVDADIGSGNIHLEGEIKTIEAKTGAGNITGSLSEVRKFKLKDGSGNAALTFLKMSEQANINIHLGSGSASVTANQIPSAGSIKIDSGVGNCEVFLPEGTLAAFDLESGMGKVSNDFPNSKASKFLINASSGLGNIEVRKIKK